MKKNFLSNMNPFFAASITCIIACLVLSYIDRMSDVIFFTICSLVCAAIGNIYNEIVVFQENDDDENQ